MLILLYGKDNYRLHEKIKAVIEGYKKKHSSGLNLVFLDKKSSFKELYDEERQVSMFGEKRLIIAPSASSSENFKKEFLEGAERIVSSENIILLYEEGEIKKNDKLLSFFREKAEENSQEVMYQEFEPLSEKKLLSWIKKEFSKSGTEVEDEATRLIGKIGSENLWRIKNEINKLALYKKKITREEVDLLVDTGIETNIFKTIDALAQRDKEKAALLLYDHLQKGDNPHYIFSMIGYQFRNLIMVSDLLEKNFSYKETKERAGLHPYVFQKTHNQTKHFSCEELKRLYEKLFEMDLKTKTGQIDPVLALHLFLFEMSSV